jgi:hypothetical protein
MEQHAHTHPAGASGSAQGPPPVRQPPMIPLELIPWLEKLMDEANKLENTLEAATDAVKAAMCTGRTLVALLKDGCGGILPHPPPAWAVPGLKTTARARLEEGVGLLKTMKSAAARAVDVFTAMRGVDLDATAREGELAVTEAHQVGGAWLASRIRDVNAQALALVAPMVAMVRAGVDPRELYESMAQIDEMDDIAARTLKVLDSLD